MLTNPAGLTAQEIQEIEQRSFREGVKACAPTLIGIAAWGLVTGIAMIKTHFTLIQALGMTLTVFAGSAQLATLPLIATGAPLWMIFLTGVMINLRFVIFSVIIAPHFSQLKFSQRAFWGYMTGDVSTVLFMQRYPTEAPQIGKFEFMKGLFIPNWAAWQIGSIAGILLGGTIPEDWHVGFAGTLAILCVLLPMVLNRATLAGVIAAGAVAVATYHWPYKLGMLLAVVVGMGCSICWEEWHERTESREQS
ncbi:putative branched-subunit amino acid permease [Oxalobacteraceae bacterium GrIS 2.11]